MIQKAQQWFRNVVQNPQFLFLCFFYCFVFFSDNNFLLSLFLFMAKKKKKSDGKIKRQQGTRMWRKMWLQSLKIKQIVLGIIIAVILIVILSVCHRLKCWFASKLSWSYLTEFSRATSPHPHIFPLTFLSSASHF